ncbi:hypothetical protein DPMN_123404 [Dreissena polymorpha]|uniref:Uncharacterized protein n=2 Tax=Dreissena polymorpha TaxID=45954 RepID=A0A9D4GUD3_DREPO|nr:hypothetical protein DPMN_123404 [Dreissena polymorpha]
MIKFKELAPEISKGVPFPDFAQGIGLGLTALVLIPIPVVFLYKFLTAKGNLLERLRSITTPDKTWGPNDGSMKRPLTNGVDMVAVYGIDNPAVVSNGEDYTRM